MDGRGWWATVHGVAKSQTRPSNTHTQETEGAGGILETAAGTLETRGKTYPEMGRS